MSEFYKKFLETAKEFGVIPTEAVEGMELAKATFTEYRKIKRSHAITIRLSGDDLDNLNELCYLTKSSKTEAIVKLIYAARFCLPAPPPQYNKTCQKSYKRRVIVRTTWREV